MISLVTIGSWQEYAHNKKPVYWQVSGNTFRKCRSSCCVSTLERGSEYNSAYQHE